MSNSAGNTPLRDRLLSLGHFLSKPRAEGVVKRALILIFTSTIVISLVFLSIPFFEPEPEYHLGQIALADTKLRFDLRYEKKTETEKLRTEAYKKERTVFDRDYSIFTKITDQLRNEFSLLERTSLEKSSYQLALSRLPYLKNKRAFPAQSVRQAMAGPDREKLTEWSVSVGVILFDTLGYTAKDLNNQVKSDIKRNGAKIRTINSTTETADIIWDNTAILYPGSEVNVDELLREKSELSGAVSEPVQKMVINRILQIFAQNPVLQYNATLTRQRKELAASRITPVYIHLKKGMTVIRAGDPIDKDKLEKLRLIRDVSTERSLRQILGLLMILIVMASGATFFIFRFSRSQVNDLSSHVILYTLIITLFAIAFFLSRSVFLRESDIPFILLTPISFLSILTGLFFGARITMGAGTFVIVYLFLLAEFEPLSLLISFSSILAGLYASTRMQKRTQIFKGALTIFLTNITVLTGSELMTQSISANFVLKGFIVFLNAYLSILLAIGSLPIFEQVFNLPTKFRLMELGDFNQPLLRKMAAIAPSTYSHSLMMANMCERAVDVIKGDTLLTRVGCLYHDIGKMENPGFYAENKHLSPTSDNLKKLGPLKAAQMIIQHVADGIRMGREARLPEKIISFIPEHHGTTTMQFFYHQALEQSRKKGKDFKSQKHDFKYPGPRPQTKETAVVMLADSIEAASRSLDEPSREEFEILINRITDNKLEENQFDECSLTFGDLKKVKQVFLEVLMSTFHLRPKYPLAQKTRELEVAVRADGKLRKGK